MAFSDYCRQIGNDKISIIADKLPSKVFVNAIKVKDIYKVRILGKQSRKGVVEPGSGDVRIISPLGDSGIITRKQLASEFVHATGKKITLATLKNDRDYLVVRQCYEEYKALKLPDNCTGEFKGTEVKNGSYIVAKVDDNNNIVYDTMSIISPQMFRKMFKIPIQPIIKKHMYNTNKRRNLNIFNREQSIGEHSGRRLKPIINTESIGLNPKNINIPTLNETNNTVRNNNNTHVVNKNLTENISQYRFKVTARLLSAAENKKLKGFTVIDLKTGESRPCTIPQVTELCKNKLVENLILVTKENGQRYLKGHGMIIENLPETLV